MSNNYAKDLFHLQSDLIDAKVDMAASKAIERVVDLIGGLKIEMHHEMHALRHDMDKRFNDVGQRLIAVESTLIYVRNTQDKISTKIIDYTFQGGWLMLTSIVIYIVSRYLGIFH